MAEEPNQQRSRRALLAAAAGGAAALAATAALPLTAVAADGDPVLIGESNDATSPTTIANTTADSDAFAATATNLGVGLKGTSSGTAGVYGVSVDGADAAPVGAAVFTGVYGWAPDGGTTTFGVGVWGDSDDVGVYGTGSIGVWGDGFFGVYGVGQVGVLGEAVSNANPAVAAQAASPTGLALHTIGKVRFSRSGIRSMKSGKASVSVTLAGTTASSKVFAVLATSEPGRWIRAVVPAAGKFTIYLNTALRSSAKVSWFVLD